MSTAGRLSEQIDEKNDRFANGVKDRLCGKLSSLDIGVLEWLVKEHHQFSFANVNILKLAVVCTAKLAERGITAEFQRNFEEEAEHPLMYKQGLLDIGTDVDQRVEFVPTTIFLKKLRGLAELTPSCALGALYATETAAIFEHEIFYDICEEICDRRGIAYEGSLIKAFHDLHLDGGVEQGHKDGLAVFVDLDEPEIPIGKGGPLDKAEVMQGALEAIDTMQVWWNALLEKTFSSFVGSS